VAFALSACASRGNVGEAVPVEQTAVPHAPGYSDSAVGTFVVATNGVGDEALAEPAAHAEAATAAIPPGETTPPPTQAELDFASIYGGEVYDPVADPTLPEPAQLPVSYDPWEPFNRRMHAVNTVIDDNVARPLAQFYMDAVPRPIRLGVGNFFR